MTLRGNQFNGFNAFQRASGGGGTLTPVGTPASAENSSDSTTLTTSFTLDAAADLLIVATSWGDFDNTSVFTGVTWNGTAMTEVPSAVSTRAALGGRYMGCTLWYLASPTTGTHDLVSTNSVAVRELFHSVATWSGAHPSSPCGTGVAANGTASPGTQSVTTATGEVAVGTYCSMFSSDVNITEADTLLVEVFGGLHETFTTNFVYNTSASPTLSWTNSVGSPTWCISAVNIKPS